MIKSTVLSFFFLSLAIVMFILNFDYVSFILFFIGLWPLIKAMFSSCKDTVNHTPKDAWGR